MRVALIHYWLVGMRGGERVLERLLHLYPNADIFTHVYDPGKISESINQAKITTTFIQRLPGAKKHYQKYLPLMPRALEALDLSAYDLVISSESGPSKGVITRPDAAHICYCHSPMRYLWDHAHLYRKSAGHLGRLGMDLFGHGLRRWDVSASHRVDRFMANSNFIRQRIQKYYRRDADIVFPPVDVDAFNISSEISGAYVWVGQLTAYKRPDIVIDAFNKLKLPLIIVGDGELEASLKARAKDNITFKKRLSFPELKALYASAKAMIFSAEEDFGITPVEVMASGRPVLAYARGGALDTVVDGVSGRFFHDQSEEALADAVLALEGWLPQFSPAEGRATTLRFRPEVFDAGVRSCVAAAIADVRGEERGLRPMPAELAFIGPSKELGRGR